MRLLPIFRYGENLVNLDVCQYLLYAAWPPKFELIDYVCVAQPKVNPLNAGRVISDSGCCFVVLIAIGSRDFHLCPQAIAVGFDANQLQNDPVAVIHQAIHKQFRWTVQYRHDDVYFSIVIEIAKRCSTMRSGCGKSRAGLGAHILEVRSEEHTS